MPRITTFLSHADEDKITAKKLSEELAKHGFDVFVAHDDIVVGSDWEQTLKDEIEKRELFIVLLSSNFRKASFTDQEIGIAIAFNKRIFPIPIDNTMPYGFMARFQSSQKINLEILPDEIQELAHSLTLFTNENQKDVDELIKKLSYANSFSEANAISKELFENRYFTTKQVNDIAKAYIQNYEVSGSWTAGPSTREFLSKNVTQIKSEYLDDLADIFV